MQQRKAKSKHNRHEDDRLRIASLPPIEQRYILYNKPIHDLTEIQPNSIDCILTDPPYPKDFIGVFRELGQFAKRVLKDGGSCFVMVGQSYLPEYITLLSESLTYHWTLAYLTFGGQAVQLWEKNIISFWKPILWFVKGEYHNQWIADVSKSATNDNDKRFHKWGQSESGMTDLIKRCTRPADWVCDPFCGGGTTGVCALRLNRQFIGNDIDPAQIETTRTRITNEISQTKNNLRKFLI